MCFCWCPLAWHTLLAHSELVFFSVKKAVWMPKEAIHRVTGLWSLRLIGRDALPYYVGTYYVLPYYVAPQGSS